jgi:acyl carrier protein
MSLTHDQILTRLKAIVISTLQLDDVGEADLADDEPLMGSGMGLDSIDALELVVQVEKEFGIKIKSSEAARTALQSLDSLARYIAAYHKDSPTG